MTPPRLAKSAPVSVVKSDMCGGPPDALRYGMTKTNPATFGSLGDWNWTKDLARVKAPTLVIHGEEDAIPMATVEEWVTSLPNARILRLPHTAHPPRRTAGNRLPRHRDIPRRRLAQGGCNEVEAWGIPSVREGPGRAGGSEQCRLDTEPPAAQVPRVRSG